MIDKLVQVVDLRKQKKDAKWWFKVGTLVLVALLVVILALRFFLRRGELIGVDAYKKILNNSVKRENYKAERAKVLEKQTEASRKAMQALVKVAKVQKHKEKVLASEKKEKEILSNLKSWRDVDKYVK